MTEERVIPTPKTSDLPTFEIMVDGTVLPADIRPVSVVVNKAVNRIPAARLVFPDGDSASEDFPLSSSDLFIPGKEIELKAGYHQDNETIFKGIIISQQIKVRKHQLTRLVVDCRDACFRMTSEAKSKYYYESPDSDIFGEIISGYESLSAETEGTDTVHEAMLQFNSTDWDFLISRAEANGMVVIPADGSVFIGKPDFGADPVLSLIYGANIVEFEGEIDSRNEVESVESGAWDMAGQELITEEGSDPGIPEGGDLTPSELAGASGYQIQKLRHTAPLASEELKSWADAKLLKSRMAKLRARVKFQGFPGVRPGNMIELKGLGERFNGKAFVSAVRHELGAGNFLTDLELGASFEWFAGQGDISHLPAEGLLPAVHGLQVGVVTQLQGDPLGEDRIKVVLPVVDPSGEGYWARISTLDAGENRGSFFRPEIGDEVIVGFLNKDPRFPVILGMVNSSAKPAPAAATDENHEKGFVTRSGMKLWFNDDDPSLLIETPAGNKILVSDAEEAITIEDQHGNKGTFDSAGISLESAKDIKLKASGNVSVEGVNIEMKAQASLKAEGSAGAEVSSGGTMVVKGSLVQIN